MTDRTEYGVVQRTLETDGDNPAIQIAEAVAEIEGKDTTELPTMYDCVDGMLDDLYSNPPSSEAQMVVEFTYAAYRITARQDGTATLVRRE